MTTQAKIDPRFVQGSGRAVFTGNELLVKGALETEGGVHLLTGYPGSPIAGYFDCVKVIGPLLEEHGVVMRQAVNEAIGMAMVNGAQMVGCRAVIAFKSVGMHVAADALALGVLAGTQQTATGESGALVVVGDDPWSDSTQVPADSRFLAEHVRLPLLEPSSPQEVKDWVDLAFKLGRAGGIYIGYMLTVSAADGGGTVECHANHFPKINAKQKRTLSYEKDIEPNLDQMVLLPPRSWRREMHLEEQHGRVIEAARKLGINQILHRPQKDERVPIGFIAAGNGYAYLAHALAELKMTCRFPILKLGMVYPVDGQLVTELARQCDQLFVIEERRSFVERQVREILDPLRQNGELKTEIYGKKFPDGKPGIRDTRGLNPSVLMESLIPLFRGHSTLPIELTNGNLTDELDRLQSTGDYCVDLPIRTATFCPGCPHRDSASVLLELRQDFLDADYMSRVHSREPVDLICHGDTGCYTMLMFEPNKSLMHNYSGMGLGGGTGAGIDPFIDNKQLVFMGDGTFHHSGQLAISQSIYTGQDITYIILENKTTAMTGHQTHASMETDMAGRSMNALNIEQIIRGMVPRKLKKDMRIVRIDPADRNRYRKLLEQTLLADGVKVVIADKECGITLNRRLRREEIKQIQQKGYLARKTHMNVATDVCEFCLECTNQTGCPGLKIADTDYGPKIQTDFSWCVNDGACHRIHACPSFEEVTILRKQPPRMGDEHVNLEDIPDPKRPIHADQDQWRCYLAGVGGMGIGTAGSILVMAGNEMGYDVQFLDKKGLAIRNGGVFSQLVFTRPTGGDTSPSQASSLKPQAPSPSTTPLIPYGKADLLIGIDLLEAARAIDPKHPYRVASAKHTAAVINTAKTPTILTLMGREDFDVRRIEATLRQYTRKDQFTAFNVGDLCERVLDSKLYANIMMLGIAFQKGLIPIQREKIENAIAMVTRHEKDRNLRAFNIGRKIAVRPELFVVEQQHEYESSRQTLRRKYNTLKAWFGSEWVGRFVDRHKGPRMAKQFRVLMKQTLRAVRGRQVPDDLIRDVVIRAYDCVIWGGTAHGLDYARVYCRRVVEVFSKDDADHDYLITRAVVWNLAKVMLIKDEIYVASMLTSPEKYRRDRRRFNVNPDRGDRIIYKHHNRPEFDLFGHRIRFEWKSTDWQLRIMSGCGFLRKLLKKWHLREKDFRDWYMAVVDKIDWISERDYQRWTAILTTPQSVTGYREVRYPKMDAARSLAEKLLATPPDDFEPQKTKAKLQYVSEGRMSLPVLSSTD